MSTWIQALSRLTALALLAPLACGRSGNVRKVTGPNGRPAALVTCKKPADCLELAGRACPHGYWTLDRKVDEHGTMLIECRPADPWAECSTQRDRWDACVASGGKCLPTGDGSSRCSWPQGAPPR